MEHPTHDQAPRSESTIKLDDVTLQQRCAHYPAELREPLMWLGYYVREHCSRDVDLLVDRAEKLEIHLDKTTWSKILRGRWNRDASDTQLESPVVALPKLLRAIEALKNDARREEAAGQVPYVTTPTGKTIMDWVDGKRARGRVCKFGVLVGETGTQKTATLKEYCRLNNHGVCKLIESSETANVHQFITELGAAYGASRWVTTLKKKTKITESINETRTIMIDNAQRLYDPRLGGQQPAFHFLQKLQEDTGCTIIISLTPQGERTVFYGDNRGFFEQFVGRAGGYRNFMRIPAYPTPGDVESIARAFKFQDVDRHLKYLCTIVKEEGRVRRLFDDLQAATIRSEAKKQRLSIAHLHHVRGEVEE